MSLKVDDSEYQELWQNLLNELPVGRFRLDSRDRIMWVNEQWMKLYGMDDYDDVIGKYLGEITGNISKVKEVTEKVKLSDGNEFTDTCLMRKGDEGYFFCEIHTVGIWRDQIYRGRLGWVHDVTDRTIFTNYVDNFVTPSYIIRQVGNDDVIVYCNVAFARLFEFDKRSDAIGFPAVKLYANPWDHRDFLKHMEDEPNSAVLGRKIRVLTRKGHEFTADTNVMWKNDEEGKFLERFGTLRDLSSDSSYTETIQQLGIVQHSFQTSIFNMRHNLAAMMDTLQPDDFSNISVNDRKKVEEERLSKLMQTIDEGIEKLSKFSLPQGDINDYMYPLNSRRRFLKKTASGLNWGELLPTRLRVAIAISDICTGWIENIEVDSELYEIILDISKDAQELERLTSLALLHRMTDKLLEIGKEVRFFQDFVTASTRKTEPVTNFDLWETIKDAMSELASYAQNKGVSFKTLANSERYPIWGRRREMRRAFSNILHNAVKYSWKSHGKSWIGVEIDSKRSKRGIVYEITVENYGVGISQDELAKGSIYKFGYRGEYSGDRGRVGMGTGLPDSRWVFQRHGGGIVITSRPAYRTPATTDLKSVPHLTRVRITLPSNFHLVRKPNEKSALD